jgi:glucokinase
MSDSDFGADTPFGMDRTILLGIDIGGTKIAAALVDADTGEVLASDRVPTHAREGGEAVLERAVEMGRTLIGEGITRNVPLPLAVGVGAGGQIDPMTGVVLSATDLLPDWAGMPIRMMFEDAFGLPVAADNDVNALGVGEARFGAGRDCPNVLFLSLGTGVGGAIIADGRLYHGARGAGGEVGHLILYPDGLPCTCGGRGCLEQYASGAALARLYQEEGGGVEMDGAVIGAEAREDPVGPAARAVRRLGEYLGLGLTSLASVLDPDKIIIGGGLSDLGDLLLDPARAVLIARALPVVRYTPVVLPGLGPDATVIGAASLALALF